LHVLSDGLHVCRGCSSTLVEPVRWDPVGRTRWALTLRCPECQWWTTGVWCDEEIERLEVVLSQAEASMVADCEALAQATIDEEIEQFARALERDEITPSDF
jgi:uncharacterized Zn finger protein